MKERNLKEFPGTIRRGVLEAHVCVKTGDPLTLEFPETRETNVAGISPLLPV